jgi:hypothetical protein
MIAALVGRVAAKLVGASVVACAILVAASRAQAADPAGVPGAGPNQAWRFGATLGILAPVNPFDSAPVLNTGAAVGVTAGHRWSVFYLGARYEHAFLGGGSWTAKEYVENTTWAASDYAGIDAMFLTDPAYPIGVSGRLGFGGRWLTYTANSGDGSAPNTTPGTLSMSTMGWDVTLGLGFPIRVGPLSLVPEGSVGIGTVLLRAEAELDAVWELGQP